MKRKEKIIIDTDPGIDDAAAIVIALNHSELDVRLITTVMGNVNVDYTTNNALKLVEFCGKDVPVARGAESPLIREYEDASYAHGETGMDGYNFPIPKKKVLNVHAVEALRHTIETEEDPITLVAIGAYTNIALLIKLYPEVAKKVKRIVIMGGSLSIGNTTSSAEFNVYADPHAAEIMFKSGIPIVMVGLDVTTKALLSFDSVASIKDSGRTGAMLHDIFKHYRSATMTNGLRMHDACAILYLVHPELFETKEMFIEICTEGPAMGATVGDIRNAYHDGKTNTTVCTDLDIDSFNSWFVDFIKSIDN